MAKRAGRYMTLEEFDAWCKAGDRIDKAADRAEEGGGPRLSLVPVPEQNDAWPTDLLPPASDGGAGDKDDAIVEAMPFDGIPLESSARRLAGWSAERQRLFLTRARRNGFGPSGG